MGLRDPRTPRRGIGRSMAAAITPPSAAALPPGLVARHNIAVVQMWLTIGGESVREGDVPSESLLGRHDVTTSGPAPGEFEHVIKERMQDPNVDAILVCTIAATMSSTHEAAVVGARAAGGPVRVIDTTTAAGAAEVEPKTAFSASFGTVMMVHTGPGLAGLAWWWEEPV